ncbi:MAG: HAD family hydrolase [Planctomycetota bacterium]
MKSPALVLFDLGGVLVQLGSIRDLWGSTAGDRTDEELWRVWLQSEDPAKVDSGRLPIGEFLERWHEKFHPYPTLEELRGVYESLIRAPFPGALDLVRGLRSHTEVGCLSNMNECHWPQVQRLGFDDVFDRVFASHLIGHAKPSDAIFEHVLAHVPHKPGEILFLDDNKLNVESAHRHGIRAEWVQGTDGAQRALSRYF